MMMTTSLASISHLRSFNAPPLPTAGSIPQQRPGDALEVFWSEVLQLEEIAEKFSRAFCDDDYVRLRVPCGRAARLGVSPTLAEREAISERTKAALTATKARGTRLGTPGGPSRRRGVDARGP
jgi:hypothetical protein